jgi:hypothetical protein
MNDPLIRKAFHCSFLQKEHASPNTLVVDELGLEHGKCRADIAVINGHINGYEIKSEKDSLVRLKNQIEIYNAVFDHSSIVLEKRHLNEVLNLAPNWWGVILVTEGENRSVCFENIREPSQNSLIDDYAVAQLLWRNEAQEILSNLGVTGKQLRECRANLYQYIIDMFDSCTLRGLVRKYLKKRQDWRDPEPPSLYDGLSPLLSM